MTAVLVLALRIGLAIILYTFLWMVFQATLKELRGQGRILLSKKRPTLNLSVQYEDGTKKAFRFSETDVSIGRASTNALVINDDAISATHASISFHHAQWWLADTGSRNGTHLNNKLIATPTVLVSGDVFKCGNTFLTIHIDPTDNPGGPND